MRVAVVVGWASLWLGVGVRTEGGHEEASRNAGVGMPVGGGIADDEDAAGAKWCAGQHNYGVAMAVMELEAVHADGIEG